MNDLEKGLEEWYALPAQTWDDFKTHFETAHLNLQRVRGPTMKSGVLQNQENFISNQLMH